jgi:hypothetical protein
VRVNRYEPERVHLAVYNWDRKDSVRIDLKGVLAAGDAYRVASALDYFGPPVVQGKAEGAYVDLPMKGHRYEPEFGAYVLFRGESPAGGWPESQRRETAKNAKSAENGQMPR